MFQLFARPLAVKIIILPAYLALSALSLNTQAALSSYKAAGDVNVVYSTVSDVTWTDDGNLLGSLFNSQGYNTVVNAIISSNSNVINTSNDAYTLTASDFASDGATTWFGAIAYVNYLNSINYAGSNQWRLPTVVDKDALGCDLANSATDCGYNVATNDEVKGDELAELYYQELQGKGLFDVSGNYQADSGIVNSDSKFINVQQTVYWSGTEYALDNDYAWGFFKGSGLQYNYDKSVQFYAWAVSNGQIAAVPEPESVVLFLAGLGLVGSASRRNKKQG